MSRSGSFLQVVRAGMLTTVQDLGRPGHAHLGVPRSGAADPGALRLANRLVGNEEGAAGLETTLDGCSVSVARDCWAVVTGAAAEVSVSVPPPEARGRAAQHPHGPPAVAGRWRESVADHGDGAWEADAVSGVDETASVWGVSLRSVSVRPVSVRPVSVGEPFYLPAGSIVEVGRARLGVRSYLAFAGGVVTSPVVGSRSFDLLSGLGGDRGLANGDVVPLGVPQGLPPGLGDVGAAVVREVMDPVVVRCVLGPRHDWFAPEASALLGSVRWAVGTASNRTALRLGGPILRRARDGEIASEGLVPGAVQVPPDGRPVVFLADHPVTGGYPVIACVDPRDLGLLGQARPGTGVRFRVAAPG